MLDLYFNNVQIPNWIKVTDIQEDILPSDNKKKFTISFNFRRNKLIDNNKKFEFIEFLKGDNFNESKLILPNRLEFYYLAKVSNLSSISGSIRKGTGSIEFIANKTEQIEANKIIVTISDNIEKTIHYNGTVDTYPILIFKVKSACSKIKFAMNDTFIELNNSFNANNVITFNQETFDIKLNDNTNMQILHLNSKRSKLKKGINTYRIIEGNCEVQLSWNNKYL